MSESGDEIFTVAKDGGVFSWEWLADVKPSAVSEKSGSGGDGDSDKPRVDGMDLESGGDSDKPRVNGGESESEPESESESDGSSSAGAGASVLGTVSEMPRTVQYFKTLYYGV